MRETNINYCIRRFTMRRRTYWTYPRRIRKLGYLSPKMYKELGSANKLSFGHFMVCLVLFRKFNFQSTHAKLSVTILFQQISDGDNNNVNSERLVFWKIFPLSSAASLGILKGGCHQFLLLTCDVSKRTYCVSRKQ